MELNNLINSEKHKFSDWDNEKSNIPENVAGIYTIWFEETFIYAGMADKNLRGRLNSHASGRRGGDQFCCYICDRYIVPDLEKEDDDELRKGNKDLLNNMNRAFIRKNLSYQYQTISEDSIVRIMEDSLRKGETDIGKPLINPK
jgi:hypothetical protein